MTLQGCLKSYPPETKLKIGAADGSGWFYVGTVGDYTDNYGIYDRQAREYAYDKKQRALAARDGLIKAGFDPKHYVKRAIQYSQDITLDGYMGALNEWLREVAVKVHSFDSAKEYSDHFKALHLRPVVSCEKAEEPDCIRVLVIGTEYGAFWETEDGFGIKFQLRGTDRGEPRGIV